MVRMKPLKEITVVLITVAILLPGLTTALQINEYVSVESLPWEKSYSSYSLVNCYIEDVNEPTTIAVTFTDSAFSFPLYLDGNYLGNVEKGRCTMYVINLYSDCQLSYQASDGLYVRIEGTGDNLTVDANNIEIHGVLQSDVVDYTANIIIPNDVSHDVNVTYDNDMTIFGITDDRISAFSAITTNNENSSAVIHIHKGALMQGIRLYSSSYGSYTIAITAAPDEQEDPGPILENVTYSPMGADIIVTPQTYYEELSHLDSPPMTEPIGTVNTSFEWNDSDEDGCPAITIFRSDLSLQRENPEITYFLDEITKKVSYGRYRPVFNPTDSVSLGDPDDSDSNVYTTITNPVSEILTSIEIIDNDMDDSVIVVQHYYNLSSYSGEPNQGGSFRTTTTFDSNDDDPSIPYGLIADYDGDGLSNYMELYRTLTNPLKKDTDNDGTDDGFETNITILMEEYGAYDTDLDGLSDIVEYCLGSDPQLVDTDNDMIEDGAELSYWLFRYFDEINVTAWNKIVKAPFKNENLPEYAYIDSDNDTIINIIDSDSDDPIKEELVRTHNSNVQTYDVLYLKHRIISLYQKLINNERSIMYHLSENITFGYDLFNRLDYTDHEKNIIIPQIVESEAIYFEQVLNLSNNQSLSEKTRKYYSKEFDRAHYLAFEAYLLCLERFAETNKVKYNNLTQGYMVDLEIAHIYHQNLSFYDYLERFHNLTIELDVPPNPPAGPEVEIDYFECKYYDHDGVELLYGITDPTIADTDGDQLLDGEERNYWENIGMSAFDDFDNDGKINIYDNDSDNDQLIDGLDCDLDNDGMEDVFEFTYDFNMTNANDANQDADNDNLTNVCEYLNMTNPKLNDTDNDGLLDGYEVSVGLDPCSEDSDSDEVLDINENLCTNDTDSDGLINGLDMDSDNDGLTDGDEDIDHDGIVDTGETSPVLWDTDSDSFPDGWEKKYNFNPLSTNSATADSDSDDLNDYEEFLNGTSPISSDTDYDGLPDGWEVDFYFNPLFTDDGNYDSDGDDLTTYQEYLNDTDFLNWDTDSDLLPDGWEVNHGLLATSSIGNNGANGDFDSDDLTNSIEFLILTYPNDNDTDDDEMPDGWEFQYQLDPLINDSALDSDNDTLTNLEEYINGTDPTVVTWDSDNMPNDWENQTDCDPHRNDDLLDYDNDGLRNYHEYLNNTDPSDPDCDSDMIPDGWEIAFGFNASDASDKLSDTDLDELNNYEEYLNQTSPFKWDTDGDTLPDGWEAFYQLNPILYNPFEDHDGDDLNNRLEYSYHKSESWNESVDGIYWNGLSPRDPDSDNDGYTDGYEYLCGFNASTFVHDETYGDIDSDTISNYAEYELGTRADSTDSDGDGIGDKVELCPFQTEIVYANTYIEEKSQIDETGKWGTPDDIHHWVGLDKDDYAVYKFHIPKAGFYMAFVRMHIKKDPPVKITLQYENGTDISYRTTYVNSWRTRQYHSATTYLEAGTYELEVYSLEDYVSIVHEMFIYSIGNEKAWKRDYDDDGLLDGYNVWLDNTTHLPVAPNSSNSTFYYGELDIGTSPGHPDSDLDFLLDGVEINKLGTDPLNNDTDFDGLIDGIDYEPLTEYLPMWEKKQHSTPIGQLNVGNCTINNSVNNPPFTDGEILEDDYGKKWKVDSQQYLGTVEIDQVTHYQYLVNWSNGEVFYYYHPTFSVEFPANKSISNRIKFQVYIPQEYNIYGFKEHPDGNISTGLIFNTTWTAEGQSKSKYLFGKPMGGNGYEIEFLINSTEATSNFYDIVIEPFWLTTQLVPEENLNLTNETEEYLKTIDHEIKYNTTIIGIETLNSASLSITSFRNHISSNFTHYFLNPDFDAIAYNPPENILTSDLNGGTLNYQHNWSDKNNNSHTSYDIFVICHSDNINVSRNIVSSFAQYGYYTGIYNGTQYSNFQPDVIAVLDHDPEELDFICERQEWNNNIWMEENVASYLSDLSTESVDRFTAFVSGGADILSGTNDIIEYSGIGLHKISKIPKVTISTPHTTSAECTELVRIAYNGDEARYMYAKTMNTHRHIKVEINGFKNKYTFEADLYTYRRSSTLTSNPDYIPNELTVYANNDLADANWPNNQKPCQLEIENVKTSKQTIQLPDETIALPEETKYNGKYVNGIAWVGTVASAGGTVIAVTDNIGWVKDEWSDGDFTLSKDGVALTNLCLNLSFGSLMTASAFVATNYGMDLAIGLKWCPKGGANGYSASLMGYAFIAAAVCHFAMAGMYAADGDWEKAGDHFGEGVGYSIDAAICFGLPGVGVALEGIVMGITGVLCFLGILDRPYTIGTGIVALSKLAYANREAFIDHCNSFKESVEEEWNECVKFTNGLAEGAWYYGNNAVNSAWSGVDTYILTPGGEVVDAGYSYVEDRWNDGWAALGV